MVWLLCISEADGRATLETFDFEISHESYYVSQSCGHILEILLGNPPPPPPHGSQVLYSYSACPLCLTLMHTQ